MGSQSMNAADTTVAIASWSASYCLVGSLSFRPPSSALSISDFIIDGDAIAAICPDGQAMSGVGTLGIGGAIGPGNAANAGYQGRPGTVTIPCQSLKHFDTPLATASRCLALPSDHDATIGAFLMFDSSSGPSRQPGAPIADTDMTWMSLNLACIFHMVCE